MIRVLWKMPKSSGWTGGLNYFRNLCAALYSLPDRSVDPVLLGGGDNLPEPLCRCPRIPAYSGLPRSYVHPRSIRNKLEMIFLGHGKDYDRYLRQNGIKLLSHLSYPSGWTSVPFLAWIPDFQHMYLPQYFSEEEIESRTRHFLQLARAAHGVLLSSETARQDFNRFHPGFEYKAHVLRFVAIPMPAEELPPPEQVLSKYQIEEPFFHVPNQIWAHKNHDVILDALCIMKKRGQKPPLVISTGLTMDHRDPGFFEALSERVSTAGMSERFRFLGLIDFREASVLMRNAVALINPSLFEGWSTTVEEAKSLGKKMLLSSIPVHQEQAHGRCSFFEPSDAGQLAIDMVQLLESYNQQVEDAAMEDADQSLEERVYDYGMRYADIVHQFTILSQH